MSWLGSEPPKSLLLRTHDGIEVHGTLESFSLHYPPAAGSDFIEEDEDCMQALFTPDQPSWDLLWAEIADLREQNVDMFEQFPYVPLNHKRVQVGLYDDRANMVEGRTFDVYLSNNEHDPGDHEAGVRIAAYVSQFIAAMGSEAQGCSVVIKGVE